MRPSSFTGFSQDTTAFLAELSQNNERSWFEKQSKRYEQVVLQPAKALVETLGLRLKSLAPAIQAVPKVNGSLFRIHRDVRFSNDKTPFKTHLGIVFWEGPTRMASSVYYVHVEAQSFMLAAGMHEMDKASLAQYRSAVADENRGAALLGTVSRLRSQGYGLGGLHYKRVPQGFDKLHPRAELLRQLGIWAEFNSTELSVLYDTAFVDLCMQHFERMTPLHRWLVDAIVEAG